MFLGLVSSTVEAGSYRFYIENETFLYNLERDRNLGPAGVDARTLTGDILKPFIAYKVDDDMTVVIGALLDIPFGEDDRVEKADPVISIHYDFSPGYRFTAGTLNHIHPLLDGLFDDILEYEDPVEQGFQLQVKKKYFRQDLWIDWRERELTDRPENFAAGNYTQFKSDRAMFDLQGYYFHFGGGLNSVKTVTDNYSFALGAGYKFYKRRRSSDTLGETGLTAHYLINNNQDSRGVPTTIEDGVLIKLYTHLWGAKFYVMKWAMGGPDFIPTQGDKFYQADHFSEIGFEKTWWWKKNVAFKVNLRATQIFGRIDFDHLTSMKWRLDFTPDKNKSSAD